MCWSWCIPVPRSCDAGYAVQPPRPMHCAGACVHRRAQKSARGIAQARVLRTLDGGCCVSIKLSAERTTASMAGDEGSSR